MGVATVGGAWMGVATMVVLGISIGLTDWARR